MKTVYLTMPTFEERREDGLLEPNTYYKITDYKNDTVAWSPDGEGFFWYDTLREAKGQHG